MPWLVLVVAMVAKIGGSTGLSGSFSGEWFIIVGWGFLLVYYGKNRCLQSYPKYAKKELL